MSRHRRWLLRLLVGAVAVGFGVVAVWRSGVLTAGRDRANAEQAAREAREQGQRAFSSLDMIDLTTANAADISRTLRLAQLERDAVVIPAVSDANAARLLELCGQLIYHRFVQPSPDEYARWRSGLGYRFPDSDTARQLHVEIEYPILLGREFPGYDEPEQLFKDLWTAAFAFRGGRSRPVGLSSEAAGLVVSFGEMRADDSGPGWVETSGELGREVWEGRWAGGHRIWWKDPYGGLIGMLSRHGTVRLGAVAFVLEYNGGERYPMRVVFFQEPTSRTWWISHVQVMNAPPGRLVMLEF